MEKMDKREKSLLSLASSTFVRLFYVDMFVDKVVDKWG